MTWREELNINGLWNEVTDGSNEELRIVCLEIADRLDKSTLLCKLSKRFRRIAKHEYSSYEAFVKGFDNQLKTLYDYADGYRIWLGLGCKMPDGWKIKVVTP